MGKIDVSQDLVKAIEKIMPIFTRKNITDLNFIELFTPFQ